MANKPIVQVKFRDAWQRTITRRFEARDAAISDADANALVNAIAAITKLGVIEASVSRPLSITTTDAEAGSSTVSTASLRTRKTDGGTYTFSLPEPKDAMINTDGTLDTSAAELAAWGELFDDGAGVLGVAGDFFVSDGETLAEVNGSANVYTILGGELDK